MAEHLQKRKHPMKSFIKNLPSSSTIQTKTVLSQGGVTCSLITLAAGDKTPFREPEYVEEHVLYVVEGRATVHFDGVNTVIDRDHALLISKGKPHSIFADATSQTKMLRVEIPPRPVAAPEIVTLTS